jgi:hypothetical protein
MTSSFVMSAIHGVVLGPCIHCTQMLNLTTHQITAQCHCVFGNWFATVDVNPDEVLDFESDMWTYLFGNACYLHTFDPDDSTLTISKMLRKLCTIRKKNWIQTHQ